MGNGRDRETRPGEGAPRARPPLGVVLLAGVLLSGSAGSCSEERRPATTPEPAAVAAADLPAPALRLLVLTDLDGYLEPCGCTSRPLGGIDRLAAAVRALRAEGPPTLLLAAGNLYFHGATHGGDAARAEAQERMRAETVGAVLSDLELAAAAPGPLDMGYGAVRLEALARAARFPLLAAGATLSPATEGPLALVASATREVGGRTVGLVGLSDLRGPDGALPEGIEAQEDLLSLGRAEIRSLRAAGADLIVALVSADRRTARRIAQLDGVDVVVHGGPDEQEVGPPADVEDAALVSAGRHGRGLVVLDLWPGRGDGWVDASVWTREVRRAHVRGQITDLEARVRAWAADPAVAAADLSAQRARLAALRAESSGLTRAPAIAGRSAFSARYVELPVEADRDAAITARLVALDRRTNEHNRVAFADWTPAPTPEGTPHYVGTPACASCHGAAVRWWRGHPHGRAYATLEDRHKNFNLSCVGCHVTGYLEPGGSTVTHLGDGLADVGCESCHGPGSQHVADPTGAAVNVVRVTPERVCVDCHNPEHSDTFVYDAYRQMLLAPGHGQPVGGT